MKPNAITILGGGMAGLAVGYYAKKNQLPFMIYEAKGRVGGNTVTFHHNNFAFDSGAHRLHDKNAEITKEIKTLLGDKLNMINVPSQIFHDGKLIDFPLSPLNLLKNMGVLVFLRAGFEVLRARLQSAEFDGSFETFAVQTYGRDIAESFLLNYSKKLWGLPCVRLSANIAGKRLKGLDLRTFLMEALLGKKAKTNHLEGSNFYYPSGGIGTIPESIVTFCGDEHIRCGSQVTKIFRSSDRIEAIQINHEELIDTHSDVVVATLPLNYFLEILEPRPPDEILALAGALQFRNLILVAFFLDRQNVNPNATVYFPDIEYPFTRLYEPKNRDLTMSPPGMTSLVAEIPCQSEDVLWSSPDGELIRIVREHIEHIGWIRKTEIIGTQVKRIEYAYPILESGFEEKVQLISGYLKNLVNLRLSGRNGRFMYSWIHDMMKLGKDITEEIK
ncbi:MAG: FAD-dependent oxidoreductase [Desulfoferrobacter sp.]